MTASHLFGCALAAALIMAQCVLPTSSVQRGTSSNDDFLRFKSVPDKVAHGSVAHVQYRCSQPCRLDVELVESTLQETEPPVFRRKWSSNKSHQVRRIHQALLRFPPSLVYRRSFFNQHVVQTQNVTLSAWIRYFNDGNTSSTHRPSKMKISKVLQITPLSERPATPPAECPSWPAELIWHISKHRVYQCPQESDQINLLPFPLASTGERFGVVRRFKPFINRDLERARLHAVAQPSVAFSVWFYLLEWCQKETCGIIHHVDRENSYASILMMLTDKGDLRIQAHLGSGEDEAFEVSVGFPLRKWIRLDCDIKDTQMHLRTTWGHKTRSHIYRFPDSVHFDDLDGFFVIGGSKYIEGIHGYYVNFKYYRLGTKQVENQLHPKATLKKLHHTHCACQEIKRFTAAYLQEVRKSHQGTKKGVCVPPFLTLWGRFGRRTCRQTWSWNTQRRHSTLFHFLTTQEKQLRAGSRGRRSSLLFHQAVGRMFNLDQPNITITSEVIALLQVSSCFGNHQASLLLATIHLAGLGKSVDQQKGHIYSLIGAAGDDRFALMHAGYKHTHGIDGFPEDLGMAYSYYVNVGAQSIADGLKIHEDTQYSPEHIYLSNKEDLNSVTDETGDAFRFLKYQAEGGDAEAQRQLATLLYWGHNGIIKDTTSAMKWFAKSAMHMGDPSAMYDYSILLIKGQGVKRNVTLGFQLLEKAATMGSISALNGLGWYHGIIRKDHRTAMKYFKEAALKGNEEGMYNLGVYYLSGKDPDSPWRDEMAAFQLFMNASSHGHIGASVEAARFLAMGNLDGVPQDLEEAVLLLTMVCELNGHLGYLIREALHDYLHGSWHEALVKYALAAETGLGLAQSNLAHLCEEQNLSDDCQWRYHNHSILHHDPHPSALLKMGDYFLDSSSQKGDSLSLVGRAILMYSGAALAGSPQGMYNLLLLAEQGYVLPPGTQDLFDVSDHKDVDKLVENILLSSSNHMER
ncbi:protein sel-1 homolog 3 isoform X2 [Genypterus blacodes]|uniref:protein sel-1 homolog 3 isoform X2 n=1 Tax=Genypterus blacodes TaxID=154954 RepID=UPI003F76763B